MCNSTRRLWLGCACLLMCLWNLSCAPKNAGTSQKIKIYLNWFPEVEHGGFYAAQTKGYFRDAGLDVEIVPGGPSAPVLQKVSGDPLAFGVVNADNIVQGRAEGTPIVALMAPIQVSPRCLIVHKKSGIKSFEEIHDMTLAMNATNAFAKFLQKKYPFKNVQMVALKGSAANFLLKDDFGLQGYVFSEPFVLEKQQGDPYILRVADVGFNPYTSCLIANEKLVKDNPELVKKVVAACVRGWQDYLAYPAETNEFINSINAEQMPLDVLEFGVRELKPLVEVAETKKHGMGHMSLERWQELVDQLVDLELIKPDQVRAQDVFTSEFLKPEEKD